jgi:phage terminase large subunit-like protein
LVLYFPDYRILLPFFWLPSEACKQRERFNKPRLDQWIHSGHIKGIPGAYISQDVLLADIDVLAGRYRIKDLAVDPWNGYDFAIRLRNKGHHATLFKQGFATISAPTKRLQEMILAKEILHDGNPVLRWCVQNCAVTTDENENIRPTKAKSRDRIDGVVASIMALGVAPVKKLSAYAKGGLKTA